MSHARFRKSERNTRPGAQTTIRGTVTFDGSGDPSATDLPGVSAVAKTATGKYKFSLEDRYASLLQATVTVDQLVVSVENDTSNDADDPHVDLQFRDPGNATPWTLTNIVSLTAYVELTLLDRAA